MRLEMVRVICLIVVLLMFLFSICYAEEYCFSREQASQIVVELEQKRLLEKEVKEYQVLIENLKKQNELLQEQNKLLREQIELLKGQVQIYRVAYEEERGRKSLTFFEKMKWLGFGVGVGAVIGIIGL